MSNRYALTILGSALIALGTLRAQDPMKDLTARAAAALGVSFESIELIANGRRSATNGQTFDAVKVMTKATGETVGLYLGADGTIADDSFFAPDPSPAATLERKISPLLRDRLAKVDNGAQPIALWLAVDPATIDFRAAMKTAIDAGASIEDARAAMRERLAEANAVTVGSAAAALSGLGFEILYSDLYAPVVFVTADGLEVYQLAELPFVDTLYPSIVYEDEVQSQVATHRWDRVHDFGVWGKGVKLAIIEDDGISNTHPDLNVVGYFNPSNFNVGFHATACAGIAGSRNATHPGHARGVELYSGNSISFADSAITAATSWAISQGVDIVNMSFGGDTNRVLAYLDRYVDYQVRYTSTTFVKSAGNRGSLDGDITSPGLGWNILAVGNIEDFGGADWDDDFMSATSSFGDPVSSHNDREKPEVSAVGSSIVTTDVANGFSNQGSGTSYSAPAIAGMAACFMQVNSALKTSPQAVRAILMAGAGHNIEGASRLSEFDGAGGINGLQAYRIVQQRHFANGAFFPSSFTTTGYANYNIYLEAGDRTRIVLAWDSDASSNYGSDVLDADLDITILAGASATSGPALALSASYDNSYEIVEFVPPTTGIYTVRINDYRFDGSIEYFGLAWTQHVDGRYVRFREKLQDVTANDNVGPSLGSSFFGLYPYDSVNPGATVYCIASAGIGAGVSLPDGRHSYGDMDALASFSTTAGQQVFVGYFGTYNSGPTAAQLPGLYQGYALNLPDIPALTGFPLFFTALTIESGHPSSIKEISVVKELKIQSHAQNLALSDDSAVSVQLPFSFPFFGQTYSTCFVGSNGNVTFGAPNTDYTESVADLTSGPPRICAFWDDLNPAAGGLVRVRQAGSEFIIEWVNVPQYGATASDANSAMMTLHSDGRIEIEYNDCSLLDAIVGVSPGGGAAATEIDITSGHQVGAYGGAHYEHFTGFVSAEFFDLDPYVGSSLISPHFLGERRLVTFTPQFGIFFGTRYLMEVDF